MNQFFSFKRFAFLVSKHWAENKKRYGLSLIAYMGIITAWFVFQITVGGSLMSKDTQFTTFFLTLFFIGTFYASYYFKDLSSKAQGRLFLLVPASAFEKLLCGVLFTVVLFFAAFLTAFYLVNFVMLGIVDAVSEAHRPEPRYGLANVFEMPLLRFHNGVNINLLLFFFSIQSLFFLGGVYFKKYNFIKTIITSFLIYLLLALVFLALYDHFMPKRYDDQLLHEHPWIPHVLRLLSIISAPLLWVVTYFRLKAKQV